LKKKEGDYVIKEIKKKNYLPIYMSHDLLSFINTFEKLKIPFKIIYITRHPVDNIFSVYKRYEKLKSKNKIKLNFNNPRIYCSMVKIVDNLLPYYALNQHKKFLKYSHVEKYAFAILNSIRKSIIEYKKYKNKSKIHFIRYDDLAVNPREELKKISNFISKKTSKFTSKSMKIHHLPRKIDYFQREYKKNYLKKYLRQDIYKELEKYIEKYENNTIFKT